MAISDLLDQAQEKARKGPPCTVCEMLETLPETESAALLRLLSDRQVRYSSLSDGLRKQGHDVASQTLSRHARGLCDARARLR